ncbi:carbohydrate ABC transporter permease [Hungatella sp.]|uniref:carbohydrate ABC transporter permease n=1 Tax=Hungatella sp. TaxID=2613924 RepID=UPI002A818CD0|nr:carbohydrate ABC transporter permease [Hungatella sp.]
MMKRREQMYGTIKLVLLILGAFIMLYPLLWLLSSSLKPEKIIFKEVGLIPSQITLENYIKGWNGLSGINFGVYFKNTIFLVLLCIVGNLITCSMTGYAFARLNFLGKNLLFSVLMVSMMLPFHVVLLPRFVMFNALGWNDSYLPLVVPKFLATEGFFCYMMVQFMRGIPRDLDEAARVDGCGTVQTYFRIIMPLCKSAVTLVTVLTLIWTWNDFFSQLIYIGNPDLFTIALGLRTFIDATGVSNYGQLFAMSIVSLLPIVFFFVIAQKQIMEGVAMQGIKG